MARLTNNEAIIRWVQDLFSNGGLTQGRSYSGDTVRTNEEGHLLYVRTAKPGRMAPTYRQRWNGNEYVKVVSGQSLQGSRSEFGPVTLGIYVPESKTFLLNGDGFTDIVATRMQTNLRSIIQNPAGDLGRTGSWRNNTRLRLLRTQKLYFRTDHGPLRYVIVPFMALEGAEVDPTTVRPIDVTRDNWIRQEMVIADPPSLEEFMEVEPTNETIHARTRDIVVGSVTWRVSEQKHIVSIDPEGNVRNRDEALNIGTNAIWVEETKGWKDDEGYYRGYKVREGWKIEERWIPQQNVMQWFGEVRVEVPTSDSLRFPSLNALVRRRGENGHAWVTPARSTGRNLREEVPEGRWYWTNQFHQLGASLFSGMGADSRRHKYISAFDNQENPAMYFLAQLPDRSGAKTYQQAIDALAPEIVHRAVAEERSVYRQGDVFAIETNLSDKEVYAMAHRRVRRGVVLWIHSDRGLENLIHGGFSPPLQDPGKDEVTERVVCPCGCGKSRRVGFGPRARRALSIYRTGHTATEVVTTRKGTTYIRGTLHHDPQIETPGRRAEHRDIRLGDRKKWHLCVRNTVPRRRSRPDDDAGNDSR